MKSSVAVALIVCGTLLVALPYVHNTIVVHEVAVSMMALGKDVNLRASMPEHADTACMLGGIAMVVLGAFGGFTHRGAD